MQKKYTQNFYDKYFEGSYSSAKEVINFISSFLKPKTIIDFGCGAGTWLMASKEILSSKILGIDQHKYSDVRMLIEEKEYISLDLTKPIQIGQKFDLAISVEVAEHLDEKYADVFVETLCNHSDIILFSAAVPLQGGRNHINERPCTYWAQIFAQKGFDLIDCIRPSIWDNNNVEAWYKNNIVLYVNRERNMLTNVPIKSNPIDIIHPKLLERIVEETIRKTKNELGKENN